VSVDTKRSPMIVSGGRITLRKGENGSRLWKKLTNLKNLYITEEKIWDGRPAGTTHKVI